MTSLSGNPSRIVWPHCPNPMTVTTPTATPQTVPVPERSATTKPYRFVMAGGGTGGHLYPGLAVAAALEELSLGQVELVWAATPRKVDQRLLGSKGDNYVPQRVQPMTLNPLKMWGFWQAWQHSCRHWQQYYQQHEVTGVLALGGYAAGPASDVAAQSGISVGLINPDALPGLANRHLMKRATKVYCQWPLPQPYAGKLGDRMAVVGCPIRRDLLGRDRSVAAAALGLDPDRPTLVVTGASLGAGTINDAMLMLLADPELSEAFNAWQVIHLAGMTQGADVRAAAAKYPHLRYLVLDYCDDMASVWAMADLAITRCGASTCAELTACGVPSILLPYPYHRDNHQRYNAMQLVTAGAAVIVDDTKEVQSNAAALKPVLIKLLQADVQRDEMARAARRIGLPEAALTIARDLLSWKK
ncbi:MAG: UDP-N-acetylglucosamine--N-acetylmuramyl-(pentapeptide) pyrophosphoryl-undecaprenol N-acetylglucosamine transferase [Phycisphaerae bacterium]